MPTAEDRSAAAWLCAALPELRAGALGDERVLAWIDEAAAAVRDGASAVAACRRLGYPMRTEPEKNLSDLVPGSVVVDGFGLDTPQVQGDYHCPAGRCSRRAGPDGNGRQPSCQVDGAPMVLRAGPEP